MLASAVDRQERLDNALVDLAEAQERMAETQERMAETQERMAQAQSLSPRQGVSRGWVRP